jgi:hypothetical protein
MALAYKHWVAWHRLQRLWSQRSPWQRQLADWWAWSGHVWHIRGNIRQTRLHVATEKARLAQQQALAEGVVERSAAANKGYRRLDVWVK